MIDDDAGMTRDRPHQSMAPARRSHHAIAMARLPSTSTATGAMIAARRRARPRARAAAAPLAAPAAAAANSGSTSWIATDGDVRSSRPGSEARNQPP